MCITAAKQRLWDLEGRPEEVLQYQVENLGTEVWAEEQEGSGDVGEVEEVEEVDVVRRYLAEMDALDQEAGDQLLRSSMVNLYRGFVVMQ